MNKTKEDIVIKPRTENQYNAIRSSADFVVLTGNTGGGKSVALTYAPIYYLIENAGAQIIYFMRNVSDFWKSGAVASTFKDIYPLIDRATKRQPREPIGEIIHNQVDMGVKFYNNSEVKFQQIDNEDPKVIDKLAKGIQTKRIIFDECNKFQWRTITSFLPRLRAKAKGKAQIYLAQNPERECFLRRICGCGEHGGGWIADNGEPIKEMDGRVMYFYMRNGDENEMYWGKTKAEVYAKCKTLIDELIGGEEGVNYEDFIMSMVFYTFSMKDNKEMLKSNAHYRALTANSSTAMSAYSNNWNYSLEDEKVDEADFDDCELTPQHIENMFRIPINMIRKTEKITVDMAVEGKDNFAMMHWIGFHCDDIQYCEKNTYAEACRMIMAFMDKHNCNDSNLIIDVQGAGAMLAEVFNLNKKSGGIGNDMNYGSGGYAFSGAVSATGKNKISFERFKDEAAYLAVNMVKCGLVTFDPRLKDKRYTHQRLKRAGATTICKHLIFERKAFVFDKTPTGRIRVTPKERQHFSLKGFSPDLFDNIVMRCGTSYSICYEELAKLTGHTLTKFTAKDMINYINVDKDNEQEQNNNISINSREILNILSNI